MAVGQYPGAVIAGDFNNDSKIDLAVANPHLRRRLHPCPAQGAVRDEGDDSAEDDGEEDPPAVHSSVSRASFSLAGVASTAR